MAYHNLCAYHQYLLFLLAWPSYPGTLPVDSSLGSGGSSGSAGSTHNQASSTFDTPYTSPTAAAAAYYSSGGAGAAAAERAKHLAFWPQDYGKYAGECGGAGAFVGAGGGWCSGYPYSARVPSHMDTHGSYLNPAMTAASLAQAEQDRRDGGNPPSFHDTYGALRNPYGADLAASPYPPPGKLSFFLFFKLLSGCILILPSCINHFSPLSKNIFTCSIYIYIHAFLSHHFKNSGVA
jgi:hypothetical protein